MLNRKFIAILALILTSACGVIPGNQINLKNYPEIKNGDVQNLDLSIKPMWKISEDGSFLSDVITKTDIALNDNKFEIVNNSIKYEFNTKRPTKCFIEVSTKATPEGNLALAYQILSTATVYILPYYWHFNFEIDANLISTKDNKTLKNYHLKDRSHEVRSLIWMLNPWSWSEPAAPEGHKITMDKLGEALARQVISDAKSLPECRK